MPYFLRASPVIDGRPQNPIASILQSHEDEEDEDEEDDVAVSSTTFQPLGVSPATATGSLMVAIGDHPLCFDDNGRRKRKYSEDSSCCTTPKVRPHPKRAKSFSCVADVLSSIKAAVTESSDAVSPNAVRSTSSPAPVLSRSSTLWQRSASMQIPSGSVMRPATFPSRSTSSGALARHKALDAAVASTLPEKPSASSWNATTSSLEYFCRRSLDISSPLRVRFRDLMVGSIGRAGSINTP
ncbi:hypothetical protein Poli38472_003458 [Pythium oligandrum]|uniref:Uncharacterized protein n=1 Tax=Pythium oligandrum TaxID=41045 RepID=A0A8K1C783_PYTOL|nr:hypothetical protein Poli38472_003458 [Pythium oligandrum]|eukprot:TMW57533.1 hypothetical protein Poli38472_003458 [Pythium oligandrum]